MSNSIKSHENPPALQGIEQAWYLFREEISQWPNFRKSDNTYTEDFSTVNAVNFKRLDSDYPAYQFQETQKTDANGSYKEQLITGITVGSFKEQTNTYQSLINKQIIVIFKTPDGKFRVMGTEKQGARIVVNTDSETVGANSTPGESYKITYQSPRPCPFYEGTAEVDASGELRAYFITPPILGDDDATNITVGLALKKLYPAYSGPCIKVRRSSDNTTMDIGFGLDGMLDSAALLSFVSGFDGFVHTWYDQGPNNNNFIQTTTGSQPRIVNAGAIEVNPYTLVASIYFGLSKELDRAGYVEPSDECFMIAFGHGGSLPGESGWITSTWSSNDDVLSFQEYYGDLYLRCINGGGSITPSNVGFGKETIIWEVDGLINGAYHIDLDGSTVQVISGVHTTAAKSSVTSTKQLNINDAHVSAIITLNQKRSVILLKINLKLPTYNMRYIIFDNKADARELVDKLKLIFLPPNYPGQILDFKESDIGFYIPIDETLIVIPYYNKVSTKAFKVLLKKQYFIKDFDLNKYQGKQFLLIEFFNPVLLKSKTALKRLGHIALDNNAKEILNNRMAEKALKLK